jgi:tetratricopeptide (TPR) repeat protein
MRVKIVILLCVLGLSAVNAEIAFHTFWEAPGHVTDIYVGDLTEDGYKEILLGTGESYETMVTTPAGSTTAIVCEGSVFWYEANGNLVWEKLLCKNSAASDPCHSNGCISALHADNICTTTSPLIFVGCCYCGTSSIIRVYNTQGVLLQELYDDDGAGNPVNIPGCVRKIITSDIDADNCKEIVVVTNLELLIYDTDCVTCTIPQLPAHVVTPGGMIYDVIVVNFDDDPDPTKEIVVAASQVVVYEHDATVKWMYEIDASRSVTSIYAYDLDSDTAAHAIDQDPDLEPELVVGESWYIYVLDNIEHGDTDPTNDTPDLKWEYSTSPYEVNTVHAGKFIQPRAAMGGSASLVYVIDYNGELLRTFNAPNEVRNLEIADFDKDGQNELVVFSNNYVSVFSTTGKIWTSQNISGNYIDGVVADLNLDGYPEIVVGYASGLYVIGVGELESKTSLEADALYSTGRDLMDEGEFVRAVIYFEQARTKYQDSGDTFMTTQCQKKITECEKFMDIDRIVATAMEELRNFGYEEASYLFEEAADLYARINDRTKMSQMRVLQEASQKLWEANDTLIEAHNLMLDEKWSEARVEATWARHSFEDVSNVFLTMSLDSMYETLKLEILDRIRECDEVAQLCDQFINASDYREKADEYARKGDQFFFNQQYKEARQLYEQAETAYVTAANLFDEIQIALGREANQFRREIDDIDQKIEMLETSEIYETYEDIQTTQAVAGLKERESEYQDLIKAYGDYAESVGRLARESRSKGSSVSIQANQSYTMGDKFFEYIREVLQPPTSIAVGLACLIVVLIGLAAGKGRYIALVFLILVLIFLGVSALHVTGGTLPW